MHITAAVAEASDGPLVIRQLTLEAPRSGEVLVKLVATGVCHTDEVMWQQGLPVPQPVVLGHEGAGIVEAVGTKVTSVQPGDHVVMSFNSCGHCPSCEEHESSYCHEFFPRNFFGTRSDGTSPLSDGSKPIHGNIFGQSSFATHAIAHERNTVVVPKDFDLKLAGPLGCGIMTGAGAVMNALQVEAGQGVAVLGTGSVGLSAILAAAAVGADPIIAVDLREDRLALALALGATHAIRADAADVVEAVMSIAAIGVNFSIDCTGIAAVIDQGVRMLAPRGTCGIVGASAPGATLSVDLVHLMSAGRKVRGIVEGDADPKTFIPALIALYQEGRFPFDKLLSFYPFSEINRAFADAHDGRAIKPVLLFDD